MVSVTKRQLAARFVGMLDTYPLGDLSTGLIQAAYDAGYTDRDLPSLIAAVEHQLHTTYGAVEVAITTAHELPAAALTEIAQTVATAAQASQFEYVHTVDASLLGGFEAQADGVSVRDSIRHNLITSGV